MEKNEIAPNFQHFSGSQSSKDIPIEIARMPGCEDLPLPSRQSLSAAGYDLHAAIAAPAVLEPGQFRCIPTGIRIALPPGYEAQIRPRSGLAARHGIGLLNAPGTIDADYRGEIQVILFNFGAAPHTFHRGDRIAQLIAARCETIEWIERPNLDATPRNEGGFGHTGR